MAHHNFNPFGLLLCLSLVSIIISSTLALKKEDCEVCITMMENFIKSIEDDSATKSDPKKIEKAFKAYCKDKKTKENRFCYYIGGTDDSATGILGEMSKPVSWGLPADKICEKLKKKDAQICELRYDKTYDFKTMDLKKLKVRDLKKILNNWDETCDGCLEKTDYIKRIEELKPKYVKDEL